MRRSSGTQAETHAGWQKRFPKSDIPRVTVIQVIEWRETVHFGFPLHFDDWKCDGR